MVTKPAAPDSDRHFMCEPSPEDAEELAGMFRLLGDVNRLRLICACMYTPICVHDLAERVSLSPSLVSHHLRLLKAARLMRAERRGKQVFYTVKDDHVRTVLRDMTTHVAEDGKTGRRRPAMANASGAHGRAPTTEYGRRATGVT